MQRVFLDAWEILLIMKKTVLLVTVFLVSNPALAFQNNANTASEMIFLAGVGDFFKSIGTGIDKALGDKKEEEKPMREGYACCNLHYEGDWISDANWGAQPFIPAGTPIKVKDFGRYRVHVDVDGKPMRLGLDYGREQESLEKFSEKIVVLEDPKARIAKFPAEIRKAIHLGQVMGGMTKEQAIIAIGYPQADMTISLDAPVWNHWASSFGGYQLIWDKNGRVKEITGDASTLARMVYRKAD